MMKKIIFTLCFLFSFNLSGANAKEEIKRISLEVGGGLYVFIPFYTTKVIYKTELLDNKLAFNFNASNMGYILNSYSLGSRYYFNQDKSFSSYGSFNLKAVDNSIEMSSIGKNGYMFGPNIGVGTDIMFTENIGINFEVSVGHYFIKGFTSGMTLPEYGTSIKFSI